MIGNRRLAKCAVNIMLHCNLFSFSLYLDRQILKDKIIGPSLVNPFTECITCLEQLIHVMSLLVDFEYVYILIPTISHTHLEPIHSLTGMEMSQ